MKNSLILATFAIVALSSTIKCEAKALFLFPLRFDYNQDKTNDHAVKTLVYASPLTGKTYNVDYRSNWNVDLPPGPTPPPLSSYMHPLLKTFKWDANWNFNHGQNNPQPPTTTSAPIYQSHPLLKTWKWDTNWNFNHGSAKKDVVIQTSTSAPQPASANGDKQFNFDLNWNFNKGPINTNNKEDSPSTSAAQTTTTTTTSTSTEKPTVGNKSNGYHKQVNVNVSFNANSPSGNLEPPKKDSASDDDEEAKRDDDKNESSSEDENNIDPITNGQ